MTYDKTRCVSENCVRKETPVSCELPGSQASLPGSPVIQEGFFVAHSPKPFFKAKRKTWYVEVGRVQHFLGNQPDHLPPHSALMNDFHRADPSVQVAQA
jgi:hypothetical protein